MALLAGLVLALAAAAPASSTRAQELAVATSQTTQEIGQIAGALDAIAHELDDLRDANASLRPDLERRLRTILDRTIELSADATARAAQLQAQLAALGTPPAPGEPPEPDEIASQRADLQQTVNNLTVRTHAASFLRIRADQMLQTVALLQRTAVLDRILLTTPPPWSQAVWRDGLAQLSALSIWLATGARDWWQRYAGTGGLTALLQALAAAVGAAAVATALVRQLDRRLRTGGTADGDEADQQVLRRAADSVRRVAAPVAAVLGLGLLWSLQGWLDGGFGAVLLRVLATVALSVLGVRMIHAITTGGGSFAAPAMLTPADTRLWPLRGYLLMLLAGGTAVLKEAAYRQGTVPLALLSVMAVVVSLAGLLILAPLLFRAAWRNDGAPPDRRRRTVLRGVLAVAAVGPVILALLGHFVLATYLFDRTLSALVLLWFLLQLRVVLHDGLKALFAASAVPSDAEPQLLDEDGQAAPARLGSYWACAALDVAMALLTLRLLLAVIDVPAAQVDYWSHIALGD